MTIQYLKKMLFFSLFIGVTAHAVCMPVFATISWVNGQPIFEPRSPDKPFVKLTPKPQATTGLTNTPISAETHNISVQNSWLPSFSSVARGAWQCAKPVLTSKYFYGAAAAYVAFKGVWNWSNAKLMREQLFKARPAPYKGWSNLADFHNSKLLENEYELNLIKEEIKFLKKKLVMAGMHTDLPYVLSFYLHPDNTNTQSVIQSHADYIAELCDNIIDIYLVPLESMRLQEEGYYGTECWNMRESLLRQCVNNLKIELNNKNVMQLCRELIERINASSDKKQSQIEVTEEPQKAPAVKLGAVKTNKEADEWVAYFESGLERFYKGLFHTMVKIPDALSWAKEKLIYIPHVLRIHEWRLVPCKAQYDALFLDILEKLIALKLIEDKLSASKTAQ